MKKPELTKLLHKKYHTMAKELFAKNGFKRFKTNDYIRITEDDIVQWINIQKHSWDTEFTYNIIIFPLFISTDFMYFAFGGVRISQLIPCKIDYWRKYPDEEHIESALADSLKVIEQKVFPYFDSIHNSENSVLGFHTNNSYNDLGLLHLRIGDIGNAHKFLNEQTVENIKKYESEKDYIKATIQENYDKFKINKEKYKQSISVN